VEDFMKQIQVVTTFLFLSLCPLWAQQSSKTPSPPGTVTGSGTTNYVPVWTGSTTQGNSTMYQTDGRIGIGTTSPQYALDVSGHINSSSGYLIGEELVLIAPGGVDGGNIAVGIDSIPSSTPGLYNTAMGDFSLEAVTSGGANVALGYSALNLDTSGGANTAIGSGAMSYNTEGGENTAAGDEALYLNTTGNSNTAVGAGSLFDNTTGSNNTATGWEALLASNATGNVADGSSALAFNTTGNYNTGVGANALSSNQSGTGNIAVGYGALGNNTTGTANIAIGYMAGTQVSATNSYNIYVGSPGAHTDTGAIRIGTVGRQTSFFVSGVSGIATGDNNAVPVVIDSNGQLGTLSSSRRFKTDIQDMGEASSGLLRLRPVTFRYKKPFANGSQPIQYGLIAEEVAEVYPDLVARSADGEIESVKYQVLDSMLLNELQRQEVEIRNLREQLNEMKAAMARGPETLRTQTLISNTLGAKAQ
jgi:hypothetical protein